MRFVPSYSLRTPSYSSGEFYVPSRLIDEGLYHTVKLPHIDSLYHDLCADADLLRNAPTVDGDDILGTAASVDGDGADEIDRRRSSSSKGTNNTRRPISIARSTSNGVDTSSMPLHVNSSRARIPRHLKRRKSQGFRKLWFLGRGRTKEFVEDSAHGGEGKSCDVDHPQSSNVPVVAAHIVESSPIDSELLSVFNVDQRAAAVGRIRARIAGHVSLLVQEAYTRWVEDKDAARQRSVEEASTATITQVGAEESGKHASDAISLHVEMLRMRWEGHITVETKETIDGSSRQPLIAAQPGPSWNGHHPGTSIHLCRSGPCCGGARREKEATTAVMAGLARERKRG